MIQIHDIENFTTNIIRMDKHVQEVRIEQFSPGLKTIYSSIAYFFFIFKINFEGQIFGTF